MDLVLNIPERLSCQLLILLGDSETFRRAQWEEVRSLVCAFGRDIGTLASSHLTLCAYRP
jgi:hypothetical protein